MVVSYNFLDHVLNGKKFIIEVLEIPAVPLKSPTVNLYFDALFPTTKVLYKASLMYLLLPVKTTLSSYVPVDVKRWMYLFPKNLQKSNKDIKMWSWKTP